LLLTRPSFPTAALGLGIAAALLAPGTAVAAPSVTATRLPVPAGATSADVFDVNNAGVAVGYADVDGVSQALRWSGTAVTRLPASAEYPKASASRVTDRGQVIGSIESLEPGYRLTRHWLPGGAAVDCVNAPSFPLGVLDANERGDALLWSISGPRRWTATVCHPDGSSLATNLASAYGIGDDGRVAGAQSGTAANGWNQVPTVVAADGTATALPVPAPDTAGVAYDLGPAGAVVGAVGTTQLTPAPPTVFVPRVAVIWVGGRTVELGTLGGTTSRPADTGRAVNRIGDVIGTSTTASGQTHAFRWRAGRMTDLGTLGGTSSTPTAVNDRGQVVGSSTTASGATHAFLWTDGRMVDLGAPGGESSSAVDVNNAGVVVGTVRTSAGGSAPYRWTVRGS